MGAKPGNTNGRGNKGKDYGNNGRWEDKLKNASDAVRGNSTFKKAADSVFSSKFANDVRATGSGIKKAVSATVNNSTNGVARQIAQNKKNSKPVPVAINTKTGGATSAPKVGAPSVKAVAREAGTAAMAGAKATVQKAIGQNSAKNTYKAKAAAENAAQEARRLPGTDVATKKVGAASAAAGVTASAAKTKATSAVASTKTAANNAVTKATNAGSAMKAKGSAAAIKVKDTAKSAVSAAKANVASRGASTSTTLDDKAYKAASVAKRKVGSGLRRLRAKLG